MASGLMLEERGRGRPPRRATRERTRAGRESRAGALMRSWSFQRRPHFVKTRGRSEAGIPARARPTTSSEWP
mgnify:CR=1 FL=1